MTTTKPIIGLSKAEKILITQALNYFFFLNPSTREMVTEEGIKKMMQVYHRLSSEFLPVSVSPAESKKMIEKWMKDFKKS